MTKQKSYAMTAARISGILLLICACVAFVVSFVYSLTIDAYEANLAAEINNALAGIFEVTEQDQFSSAVVEETSEYTLYEVSKNGEKSYCIQITGKGFGGNMSIMVGYNPDKTISGVSVVSHAETPGIGSKATEPSHLGQYEGKNGTLTISKKTGECDIDAIGGATISSKAIHEAINRANEIVGGMN